HHRRGHRRHRAVRGEILRRRGTGGTGGATLTRRIIPCLDVKDGRVVKGVRFRELRDAGDPVEQARAYGKAGADELCFLDISASLEARGTLVKLVESVARELSMPFAVGGGVRSAADAEALLRAGADKV